MHEISLIQGLLEMVGESAAAHGITHVERVRLVVGEWYGVLPHMLSFAFETLTQNTICQGAVLEIETKQGKALYVDFYEGE